MIERFFKNIWANKNLAIYLFMSKKETEIMPVLRMSRSKKHDRLQQPSVL